MVPTTTTPKGLSQQEALYRGVAMSQLRILKQQMQLGKLNLASRKVTLDNGVEIYCNICFNKEDVYVFVPPTAVKETTEIVDVVYRGVIFHPRSGALHAMPYTVFVSDPLLGVTSETKYLYGIAGGWKNGKTELTTEYIYPLVDEDNASFLVTKPDDAGLAGEFLGETGNYGNLYWWNGDEEDPVYLSWKGTPTRHFRLPSNIDIPGLSIFETSTPGIIEDTPVYTTFGTKIYQGGQVFAEAPKWSWPYNPAGVDGRCLILGTCQDTSGDIYIVTQSDHYNAPENVFIFSDGNREEGSESLKQTYLNGKVGVTCIFEMSLTKPGFFLTLWKLGGVVDGWSFVSEHSYSRTGLPWFANADGTEFISSNGDKLVTNGAFTHFVGTTGHWKESMTTASVASMKFDADYSGFAFYEYDKNLQKFASTSLSFESSTSGSYTESKYTTYHGVFPLVIHPDYAYMHTAPLSIIGPTKPNVGDTYSTNTYADQPVTYTASGGIVIDKDTGVIISVSGCGTSGSITATNCHGSFTRTGLAMPTGVFVLDYVETYFAQYWTATTTCEQNNGDTFLREYVLYIVSASSIKSMEYNYIDGFGCSNQEVQTGITCNLTGIENSPVSECSTHVSTVAGGSSPTYYHCTSDGQRGSAYSYSWGSITCPDRVLRKEVYKWVCP